MKTRQPTEQITIRMDSDRIVALSNLAYALSMKGERGQKGRRVTISDLMRIALDRFNFGAEAVADLYKGMK